MKAAAHAERGYEHVRVENEGLAQALTKAEEAARYYEQARRIRRWRRAGEGARGG